MAFKRFIKSLFSCPKKDQRIDPAREILGYLSTRDRATPSALIAAQRDQLLDELDSLQQTRENTVRRLEHVERDLAACRRELAAYEDWLARHG